MSKISKIECIPTSFPLKTPFTMSGATITCIYSVIVKIYTDDGFIGFGETGDTSPWYIGDSQESVIGLIKNIYGPQFLLGQDPTKIEKIMAGIDRAVRYNNQSKAVVDFALHDLKGKVLGVPVYQLLGGLSQEKIPLPKVVGASTPEKMVEECRQALDAGYFSLKIKVGAFSVKQDAENIKAIREAFPDAKITADANSAWDYMKACDFLEQVEKCHLAYLEQPLPWWDIDGLGRLRRHQSVPIFADESMAEPSQVLDMIKKDAVDGFMVKLAKIGGYFRAQQCIALAKTANKPVTCGCFKGSGIESAIQAHFLGANEWMTKMEQANLGPIENHEILDTVSVDIKTDYVKKLPRYENGYCYVPEGPGLGVELNDDIIYNSVTEGKQIVIVE